MAIQYGLLGQGLPNFSSESLIQSALTQRGQNMNALQNALQMQGQQGARAQQTAASSRAQQESQLARQAQQPLLQRQQALRERTAASQEAQADKSLLEQQRQFDTKIQLGREEQEQGKLFAKAYADGNRTLMYSIDPEKAQKLEQGDRKTMMEMQKAQKAATEVDVKTEQNLRKEFLTQTKSYSDIADSYAGVQGLKDQLNDPNNTSKIQAQTALVYKIAKMLDPGGRVTDGDYESVMGNKSAPSWLKNMLTRATNNELLTADQEARLLQVAEGQFKQAKKGFDSKRKIYGRIAKESGVDPSRVAIDFTNPGTVGTAEANRANLKAMQARRAELMKKLNQ